MTLKLHPHKYTGCVIAASMTGLIWTLIALVCMVEGLAMFTMTSILLAIMWLAVALGISIVERRARYDSEDRERRHHD